MCTPTPPRSPRPRVRPRAASIAHLAAGGLVVAGLLTVAGCSDPTDDGSQASRPAPAPRTTPPPIDATGGGSAAAPGAPDLPAPDGEGTSIDEHPRVATLAGLRAPKPATWQWQSPRPMRAGNWTIPGRSGGDFAELTAFVGIGGGIEANLTRWVGQFRSPEMRVVEPERWEVDVPGLDTTATMVQVTGEFGGMSGAFKPGQALLGALMDSPVGPIQLKLTGPEEVVLAAREDFEAMVTGLAPRAAYPLPGPAAPDDAGADAADSNVPDAPDAPGAPATDAPETLVLEEGTGWPLAWFSTTGDPPARRARHLEVQGGPAPTIELAEVIGGPADLASLRGSIVVVDFWGTWCAPCMKAIPKMIELQAKHRSDDVVFLGVHSTLAGPRPMADAATDLGINYPIGRDVDRASELAWGVRQWPYYAIVGRDGTVIAAGLRSDFVGEAIARVLQNERESA